VTFVTGHAASDADPDLDWAALARTNQTVVVYMGLSTAPKIAARLMAAGRASSTPVVVIENASLPQERRIATTLGGLGDDVAPLDGPALLVIGEVAALEHSLLPLPETVSAHRRLGLDRDAARTGRRDPSSVSLREPLSPARGDGKRRVGP
jgi:uroporphyrin-III C-methyltransferase